MTAVTLRRYTNLAATIHILRNRALTLLNPATWDDRNDAYFMSQYKQRKGAKTLLALCFAEAPETYHHWRVFSHGSDGVCLEFDKNALVEIVEGCELMQARMVEYKEIESVQHPPPSVDKLPFLKRYPYKPEMEFRLIYVNLNETIESERINIPLDCITQITLSPWMAIPLASTTRETLLGIDGCHHLSVRRSSLIENEKWKRVARGENPNG